MVGKVGRDFKNLRICYMIKKGFGGLASENAQSRFNPTSSSRNLGRKSIPRFEDGYIFQDQTQQTNSLRQPPRLFGVKK